MLSYIDSILNRITMYRLVLYYLSALVAIALVFAAFEMLPFSAPGLLYSLVFVVFLSWIVNRFSSYFFGVPTNLESVYITALILVLIITPPKIFDITYLWFIFWVALLSQTSKYIFAVKRKHFFNPAAMAVAVTAMTMAQSASWWVGTSVMLPFVFAGGLLMVRKMRRFSLVSSFVISAILAVFALGLFSETSSVATLGKIFFSSPLFFLGFIMLTEPLTTPPTRNFQIIYGSLVGLLFIPQIHIGSLYSTPELALLVGNVFSFVVSPKQKLLLKLKERIQLSPSIYNFVFNSDAKMAFKPGQYLEWTLDHEKPDSRGNRRYFTIASSPTEKEIIMGVKFYEPASSFKKSLLEMRSGDSLLAGQLAGDFTLSGDPLEKSVFIAGGIGVTPFRSIVKNLLDTHQKRDIVLFYGEKTQSDLVYKEIFEAAASKLDLRIIYVLSDAASLPRDWRGKTGFIDAKMIVDEVPDFKDRVYYISGPHAMVTSFEKMLLAVGIKRSRIKKDFFPGFA